MSDFDHNKLGQLCEGDLKERYERGDFVAPDDVRFVESQLEKHVKEREFLAACEKASKSAALVAQRRSLFANIIAAIALILSLASLLWQIYSSSPQA